MEVSHLLGNRDQTALDLKVSRKLLQSDLRLRTHDDVRSRLVNTLARSLHLHLPAAFESETTEHDGFGGTSAGCAQGGSGLGSVPEVRDHRLRCKRGKLEADVRCNAHGSVEQLDIRLDQRGSAGQLGKHVQAHLVEVFHHELVALVWDPGVHEAVKGSAFCGRHQKKLTRQGSCSGSHLLNHQLVSPTEGTLLTKQQLIMQELVSNLDITPLRWHAKLG